MRSRFVVAVVPPLTTTTTSLLGTIPYVRIGVQRCHIVRYDAKADEKEYGGENVADNYQPGFPSL